MNSNDLCKDIFRLAVRLVGLYFLYLGLSDLDVPAFMDMTILKSDDLNDVISTLLPVVFNLAVGWCLIGNNFLTRRAYPVARKIFDHSQRPAESAEPTARSVSSEDPADLKTADRRLAALVDKPKPNQATP